MSLLLKNVILNWKKVDIYIEKGRIKKIGKKIDKRAKEKIDARGEKAVLPGFINCHTHSPMTLFRGYADDLPLEIWLKRKIWPKEAKLTLDDIYWGTKLALLEMVKSGTTCFNDMYWHPEITVEALKEINLRAVIGLILVDFHPQGRPKEVERIYSGLEKEIPQTVSLSLSPHSIYTVSKENLIWAKKFAKRHNLILHLHLSETLKEVRECQRKYKLKPVEFLEKLGFLGKDCLLCHSIWVSQKEIEILRRRNSSVVYSPCSNMKLGSGIFPYSLFKKAKINICLGTDGAGSNNNLDMLEEMKFASLLQKVKEKNPSVAPAKEVFDLATKNGAKALKIEAGEIKEGKLADLILIDLNNPCLLPSYNIFSGLVYSCNRDCISETICDGKLLMREKKVEGEKIILREIKRRYGKKSKAFNS